MIYLFENRLRLVTRRIDGHDINQWHLFRHETPLSHWYPWWDDLDTYHGIYLLNSMFTGSSDEDLVPSLDVCNFVTEADPAS